MVVLQPADVEDDEDSESLDTLYESRSFRWLGTRSQQVTLGKNTSEVLRAVLYGLLVFYSFFIM